VASHDVSVRSMETGRRERTSISLGDLAKQATA
jgi:hypothetical protein